VSDWRDMTTTDCRKKSNFPCWSSKKRTSLSSNLFSIWYSWKIAHVTLSLSLTLLTWRQVSHSLCSRDVKSLLLCSRDVKSLTHSAHVTLSLSFTLLTWRQVSHSLCSRDVKSLALCSLEVKSLTHSFSGNVWQVYRCRIYQGGCRRTWGKFKFIYFLSFRCL